jgi:uncharacterized protein (TIRG00374 family)
VNRRLAWLLVRLGVSAALVGWLLCRVDAAAVARQMSEVGLATVLATLALQFLNTALKSYKWQRLLLADGIHVSHATALPSSIGGDAVRAIDLGRRSGRGVATATSVVADRVLGFAAIGIVGLLSLAAGWAGVLAPRLRWTGAGLYAVVLVGSGVLFQSGPLRFARNLRLRRLPRLERSVATVAESIEAYRGSGRLGELLLLSVAAQAIVVVAVYVIGRSLRIEAPLSYFFVIVPLVSLVESIPVSIYGIGLRDVSYAYLLGLVGVPRAQALSLSLLYVLLTLLYALFGAVAFALRGSAAPAKRVRTG